MIPGFAVSPATGCAIESDSSTVMQLNFDLNLGIKKLIKLNKITNQQVSTVLSTSLRKMFLPSIIFKL